MTVWCYAQVATIRKRTLHGQHDGTDGVRLWCTVDVLPPGLYGFATKKEAEAAVSELHAQHGRQVASEVYREGEMIMSSGPAFDMAAARWLVGSLQTD